MKAMFQKLFLAPLYVLIASASVTFGAEDYLLIPRISTKPVIDAQVDQIWYAQEANSINVVQSGSIEDMGDASALWYGLYDNERLYLLVDITDDILSSSNLSALHRNDRIEVFFNMDNLKPGGGNGHSGDNYQYAFNLNMANEKLGANANWTGVNWSHRITDRGWLIELSIPWSSLNVTPPSEGFSFGFDIAVNDNDGNSSNDAVLYWYNTGSALYSNIDGAGTIEMGGLFNGNYAPVILTETSSQTTMAEAASTLLIEASDFNTTDILVFSSLDLPDFASFADNQNGSASINLNPALDDVGIYYFSVSVSDGSLSDEIELSLVVKDPAGPRSPQFQSVDNVSVVEGTLVPVSIYVTDVDSINLAIQPEQLPGFAQLVDNGDKTATLFVQPGFGDTGTYTVVLQADDGESPVDSISFSITVTQAVNQTVFYCDPVAGSMDNDGSSENPWSSLEAVFEAGKLFKPGDQIYLRSGYHGEPSITDANTDYVYILPDLNADPTFSRIEFSSSSSYWSFSGATISRSFAPTYSAAGMISLNGKYNIVEDCEAYAFDDISEWEVADWLAYASGVTGASVNGQNCILRDSVIRNIQWGVMLSGSGSVVRGCRVQHFSGDGMRALGNNVTIENCFISDNYKVDSNHDDCIQSYTTGVGGVGKGVISGVVIRGNTLVNTTRADKSLSGPVQGIGCFDGMFKDWVIENNIIVIDHYNALSLYGAINCRIVNNTVIDQAYDSGPGPAWLGLFRHKDYENATSDEERNYLRGSGNLVMNNLATSIVGENGGFGTYLNNRTISGSEYANYFVNFPSDLRLKAGSPAIDAGKNEGATSLDADGVARPVDGDGNGTAVADLGAYEYQKSSLWRGIPLQPDGTADTGHGIGWVYTSRDPWLYAYKLSGWIFVAPTWTPSEGGWIWIRR